MVFTLFFRPIFVTIQLWKQSKLAPEEHFFAKIICWMITNTFEGEHFIPKGATLKKENISFPENDTQEPQYRRNFATFPRLPENSRWIESYRRLARNNKASEG